MSYYFPTGLATTVELRIFAREEKRLQLQEVTYQPGIRKDSYLRKASPIQNKLKQSELVLFFG
jgi:hypothetical protein